jgi:uncharacterized membrane protein
VTDHCLRSRNYVNVVVAGKQPAPVWLTMDQAIAHCTAGVGIWEWASNDKGSDPDVVMACCGDVPTLETLAAVDILRQRVPEVKIRVLNVVDLMKLQPSSEHPHGLSDPDFDVLFTKDKPIIFAFHGYPWLIHRLTYRRANHGNLHVRGYKEEGTTTTPSDMTVRNEMDRSPGHRRHRPAAQLGSRARTPAGDPGQADRARAVHRRARRRHAGITGWKWGGQARAGAGAPRQKVTFRGESGKDLEPTMSQSQDARIGHLWAIGYDDMERAGQVRDKVTALGWGGPYFSLADVSVAVRHRDGSLTIDREPFPAVAGVVSCAVAGFIVGLVVAAPLTGAAVGALLGGAETALAARVGIGDDFVRDVEAMMKPGTSVLFVLDDEGDMDVILHAIRGLGGQC